MRASWIALAGAVSLACAAWAALDPERGGLAVLLAAVAVLAAGFAWLESSPASARDLTLVATLAGIAAAGRVLFAPVPGVQPVSRTSQSGPGASAPLSGSLRTPRISRSPNETRSTRPSRTHSTSGRSLDLWRSRNSWNACARTWRRRWKQEQA